MRRFLEIDHRGIAFHEPDPLVSFVSSDPPTEVIFCDCAGVGRICHHTYANGHEVEVSGARIKGMIPHPERAEMLIPQVTQGDFKQKHSGNRCAHRRQIFVDVTYRPEAQLGMHYDEKTDTFSDVKV